MHIYTEDHRHPAVYTTQCSAGHCNATQVTGREYVPVVLPCIPTHPSVDISLHKWKDSLPSGIYFLPESGYHFTEPEVALHNGTYLCVFKDVSGSKVKKLVIDLIITKKWIKKTQLPGIYINKIGSGSQRISVSVIYYIMFILLWR